MRHSIPLLAGITSALLVLGTACEPSDASDPTPAADAGCLAPADAGAKPERVYFKKEWRQRCASDETCDGGRCCFGLCVAADEDQAFCEACPCEDESLCEPREVGCDQHPIYGDEVPEELVRQLYIVPTEPWRTAPASWPIGFGECAPVDLCATSAAGGAVVSVTNTSTGDQVSPTCDARGKLAVERRLQHDDAGDAREVLVTRQRDQCGDGTVVATSYRPKGKVTASYHVDVIKHADGFIAGCRAEWTGESWQDQGRSVVRELDNVWTAPVGFEMEGGTPDQVVTFDREGRLLHKSTADFGVMAYQYSYDEERLARVDTRVDGLDNVYLQSFQYLYADDSIAEYALDEWLNHALRILSLDAQGRPTALSVDRKLTRTWNYDAEGNLSACGDLVYEYGAAATCHPDADVP